MKALTTTIVLLLSIFESSVLAQSSYRLDFRKANPIPADSVYPNSKIIQIHEKYLEKAIKTNNIKEQFYGQMYLYRDYMNNGIYVEANKYIVASEKLAKINRNNVWLADVLVKKGALDIELNHDYQNAIKVNHIALSYALKTTDSLCIGEVYEQLSSVYGQNKDFANAKKYFEMALPLIKKYGDNLSIGITYSNYSNLQHFQKKFTEAIQYYDSAIFYARKSKHLYNEISWKANLSGVYLDNHDYKKAIETCLEIEPILNKNAYKYLLSICYDNLAQSYENTGNYKAATNYYKKHYVLDDSLNGANVIEKIATYTAKIGVAEKDSALKTSKIQIQKRNFIITLISVVLIFLIILLIIQINKNKRKLKHNEQSLTELTDLLIEKNRHIAKISDKQIDDNNVDTMLVENAEQKDEYFDNIYDSKILTDKDWEFFKNRFDKVFPNLITRIRTQFTNISESEERLFLFLKLNLKSKEIADILGITTESVKRTRNRLRLRMQLKQEVQLEDFIRKF